VDLLLSDRRQQQQLYCRQDGGTAVVVTKSSSSSMLLCSSIESSRSQQNLTEIGQQQSLLSPLQENCRSRLVNGDSETATVRQAKEVVVKKQTRRIDGSCERPGHDVTTTKSGEKMAPKRSDIGTGRPGPDDVITRSGEEMGPQRGDSGRTGRPGPDDVTMVGRAGHDVITMAGRVGAGGGGTVRTRAALRRLYNKVIGQVMETKGRLFNVVFIWKGFLIFNKFYNLSLFY
jgi:hypothetical protein